MEKINKIVYVVVGNGKEIEYKTKEEAKESLKLIADFCNNEIIFNIEKRNKTEYKIEKGDRVHWKINGEILKDRVDEIIKITSDAWGDIRYKTQQINGDKIGLAYEKDLF